MAGHKPHSQKYSLVEFFDQAHDSPPAHSCGYCHRHGSIADGLWAYRMTVADYQSLLHRGWRRSGKYVYKPLNNRTCCPQYAIRCDALNFQLTKSQKKVLKRMHNFLAFGTGDDKIGAKPAENHQQGDRNSDSDIEDSDGDNNLNDNFIHIDAPDSEPEIISSESLTLPDFHRTEAVVIQNTDPLQTNRKKEGKQRKAKEIRLEKKMLKLSQKGLDPSLALKRKQPDQCASLELFLEKPMPEQPKHRLDTRMVCYADEANRPENLHESFALYKKYELAVHKKGSDAPEEKQFLRFLIDSPLIPQYEPGQNTEELPLYGSMHMEYYLDGKLIAIDVLDILPDCVTSVYFFYDTDYRYLSLGSYSVLQEVALVRQLHQRYPNIKYASLGFYVSTCPKMQYKAKFLPSQLLCPETYTWHPIEHCLPKLKIAPYARFSDASETDVDGQVEPVLDEFLVLFRRTLMTFAQYKTNLQKLRRPSEAGYRREMERFLRYARLVGRKCANMAVYCDSAVPV